MIGDALLSKVIDNMSLHVATRCYMCRYKYVRRIHASFIRAFRMTLHMAHLAQCGSADITMKQVLDRFGKRLIIVVTELDTGKEF